MADWDVLKDCGELKLSDKDTLRIQVVELKGKPRVQMRVFYNGGTAPAKSGFMLPSNLTERESTKLVTSFSRAITFFHKAVK